ncbi:unnamed protein product [Brassica oleracea var. botrytis]
MSPSLYPIEWWEYVMEYIKEITYLLNNSVSSGCWIKLVMGTLDEVGVTRERR